MTLANYGKVWQWDHCEPLASFDLTDPEEQRYAFGWGNLRPLPAAVNIAKGPKSLISLTRSLAFQQKCRCGLTALMENTMSDHPHAATIARFTASCLTALVALTGCANSVDEHVSKQRQVRRLEIMQPWGWLETRRDIEIAMVECMRKSQLLEIGVATPADRPCKDDDWRINTTTTAAGMTTQYVYRDPDGSAAYLYFDADNKLVAKQWF